PSLGGGSHGGGVRVRGTQPNIDMGWHQHDAERNQESAYRPCDEYGEIAARDQHGPAKILLEARSEHETEQDRRRVEAQSQQDIAQESNREHLSYLEQVVVGGVDPDADEKPRAGIEIPKGDGQHFHPPPD